MLTKRPKVYIAGPIRRGDLVENIRRSDLAFQALALQGCAPWNPMWSCFSGSVRKNDVGQVIAVGTQDGGLGLDLKWLDIDLEWVAVADGVCRLPGHSVGADMETTRARELGIPVFEGESWEEAVRKTVDHFHQKGII